jgi:hypothetical protein
MKVIKEILLAWKWILFFGFMICLLDTYISYKIVTGMLSINLAISFILFSCYILLITIPVGLHKRFTLNGQISDVVGFFTSLLTFLISMFFSKIGFHRPISNFILFNKLSFEEIKPILPINDNQECFQLGFDNIDIFLCFIVLMLCCFFIGKVFKTSKDSYKQSNFLDF